MIDYLVTTKVSRIPSGRNVAMIDGTTPGWGWKPGDLHFDHHRVGGAKVQISEIPDGTQLPENVVLVTTQVDADACVAAAWLQLLGSADFQRMGQDERYEVYERLYAIAYDCDHLAVAPKQQHLAEFAAKAVAALKSTRPALIQELGLPEDSKTWSEDQHHEYAATAFRCGTEWLMAAALGRRPWPGEQGEADEYWQDVEAKTLQLREQQRISYCHGIAIADIRGMGYVDSRAINAAIDLDKLRLPAVLTVRVPRDGNGLCYTLGSHPGHRWHDDLDYTTGNGTEGIWLTLTKLEAIRRGISPILVEKAWGQPNQSELLGFDPWGGRDVVGGSGWNTPSVLLPHEIAAGHLFWMGGVP